MDTGTAALIGASIGAAASIIASVVVPWIRDVQERKRQKRAALAGLVRDVFGAFTFNGIAHLTKKPEDLMKLAADEGRIMMEIHLAVGGTDATIANAVMVGFTAAMSDPSMSGDLAGYFARALPQWLDKRLTANEVWSGLIESFDIPDDILTELRDLGALDED